MVNRARVQVAVGFLTVATVREVAGDHRVASDAEFDGAVVYRFEARCEIALDPILRSWSVAEPATIVIPGHQQFRAVQTLHERQGVSNVSHRDIA